MPLPYAILVGVLFAVAIYLLLQRSIVDDVFGLIVLGNAANLAVFGAGDLRRGAAPILHGETEVDVADPLPQALVLTAIVIGFGVVAFAAVLVTRLRASLGTEDEDEVEEVEHGS